MPQPASQEPEPVASPMTPRLAYSDQVSPRHKRAGKVIDVTTVDRKDSGLSVAVSA